MSREPSNTDRGQAASFEVDAMSPAVLADPDVYAHLSANRSTAAVHGAFWSTVNSIIPTLLNSAVFVMTSRFLLPQDFGTVAMAVSIVAFGTALGPGAYTEAIIQQKTVRRSQLDTIFWICLVASIVLYGLIVGGSGLIAHKVGHDAISVFLPVIGAKIFFDLLAAVPNALIARSMAFHLIALRTGIATLVSSALCVGLLLGGYGIWALAISQIALSATSCVAAFWGAGWLPRFKFKFSELGDLNRYGIFASGNRFLRLMNLDQLLIGGLIGIGPLGIYNFSRRLFQMINDVLAGGLSSVSHALLSSLQDNQQKVREAFLLATFGCSIVAFPTFLGLAAIAGDMIPFLFGPHWAEAIWPTRAFCIIGLMASIGVIQTSLITSQGKADWWFYYQLLRNVLTLATIVVLRNHTVTDIVNAIALQVILLWPITLWMVSKIIKLSITEYFIQFVRPFPAYVAMLIAVGAVWFAMSDAPVFLRLVCEVFAGATVYAGTLFLVCRGPVLALVTAILARRKGVALKTAAGL